MRAKSSIAALVLVALPLAGQQKSTQPAPEKHKA